VIVGQTSSFELVKKIQPGSWLFDVMVNMGGPKKGRVAMTTHENLGGAAISRVIRMNARSYIFNLSIDIQCILVSLVYAAETRGHKFTTDRHAEKCDSTRVGV